MPLPLHTPPHKTKPDKDAASETPKSEASSHSKKFLAAALRQKTKK